MNAYLSKLNEREKWMVIGALFCVVAYVYCVVLYNPIVQKIEQRQHLLAEKIETLAWMKKVQQKKMTTQTKKSVNNSQLLTLLATQLKQDSTVNFPYQLQQTSSGEIQLSFDQVPFNLFMSWLSKINTKYYLNIKQFSANKTATPGIAQLMIILSAA